MLPFIKYAASGLSVIPVGTDKRPTIGSWGQFQKVPATPEQINAWGTQKGIAIVAGAVSGNLVCVDVDTKHDSQGTVFQELIALLEEWGHKDTLARCVMERTPSGGWHILFRAPFVVGCEKLCRDKGKQEAMIETKGEGGYFVCAPTLGWELKHGELTEIPTLSESEANAILSACWALDRNDVEIDVSEQAPQPRQTARNTPTSHEVTPLDDYSDRVDFESLEGLLLEGGWRRVGTRGQNAHYCRPGKTGRDTSATLHMDKRVFFTFSTGSQFEAGKGKGPAALYAAIRHNGDFKAAAKDLAAQGYGTRRENKPDAGHTTYTPEAPKQKLLLNMDDLDEEMYAAFDTGEDNGKATEWPEFEFRIAENQMTVVTGYPSSGKSTFVQSIAVHMAKEHGWRWVIASMEDFPNRRLGGKLIRKYIRKGTKNGTMTRDEYRAGWKWVKEHFIFVNAAAESITATGIIHECEEMNKVNKIHGLILDPWSEMDEDRPSDVTETDFIKVSLKNIRKFCRANEVHTFILAHPVKPQRNKSGDFHVLNLYDIAGSHHWRAKADNGFIVRRDLQTGITSVDIQKIKFAAYGKIGATSDFTFDVPTECYYPLTQSENFLGNSQPEEEPYWDK